MATVHPLPLRPALFAAVQAAPRLSRAASEIDVAGIAFKLRMRDRPLRAIIATIRLLVDKNGFPPPRSPRIVKGERLRGSDAVWAKSLWDRDEVELWFDDDLPPAAAARAAAATRESLRADLQTRARDLVAAGGGR